MGGGLSQFIPKSKGGKRDDKLDLIKEWKEKNPKGTFVTDRNSLLKADKSKKIFGLFNKSHMNFDEKRNPKKEPSIKEMTKVAIEALSSNEKGYVLLVEGGRIDHGNHLGIARLALGDTIAMSKAVDYARKNTSKDETLIVVTSDHGHVLSFSGYPTRGNPILGKVITNDKHGDPKKSYSKDLLGLPYTTLNYTNGGGYMLGGKIKDSTLQATSTKRKRLRDLTYQRLIPKPYTIIRSYDSFSYGDTQW